jgi:hypothetical protein
MQVRRGPRNGTTSICLQKRLTDEDSAWKF